MSEIKVDKVSPQSGTELEIGDSGDTVTVPSGATLDISDATLTPPATMPASSGANLTSLPAGNLTGTVADARISTLTASKLSGIVPTANLGTGTANADTFLNGSGAYSAAGGGAFTLINSATADDSAYVEVTGMTTTYDSYLLLITRLIHGNDNSQCGLTFSTASGYLNSASTLCRHSARVGSDSENYESNVNTGTSSLGVPVGSAGNVGGEAITMSLWIHNATSNLAFPMISGTSVYADNSGVAQGGQVVVSFKTKHILTAMKVSPDAGTITSGRVSLYGIAHA